MVPAGQPPQNVDQSHKPTLALVGVGWELEYLTLHGFPAGKQGQAPFPARAAGSTALAVALGDSSATPGCTI